MSVALFVEVLGSLALQATVFLAACGWFARRAADVAQRDRMWATTHVLLLALAVIGLALPHHRWVVSSSFTPANLQPRLLIAAEQTGWMLSAVWLSGSAVYAAFIGIGLLRGTLLVRRSRRLTADDPAVLHELRASRFGSASHGLEIRVSPQATGPFLWQFHRPIVVLPELLLQFPEQETRAIVQHEIAHFEFRHPLHLFLQRLVEMAFWFHPVVWRASGQAAAARELRCDAAFVRSAEQAASYLRSLIRLMEIRMQPGGLLGDLRFLGDRRLLKQRTSALLRRFSESPHECESTATASRPLLRIAAAFTFAALLWLPLNPTASRRSFWSPWPSWSARALRELGLPARDYEIDGHRISPHKHAD